jgi:hypothetical protein
MGMRLKFCPACSRHFPTRMAYVCCPKCRSDARRKKTRQAASVPPTDAPVPASQEAGVFKDPR